ncbi:hypothetical protein K432DRAFT_431163 [Lepidopterella palustris CBS 459.81]|uniref:NADH-ubiquinone oxidoreductase 213 kDa subunit n=1 Tax=Lepidopterella palustris CBS 459.81 TaxID=1314670 RepID=A0A8E2ELQ5_9PEZI|nr:hypothetical protein K432DRAFT_431163 [Lepidopterella palustris CBS 459.81]
MASDHAAYHPKDAISSTVRTMGITTGAGAIIAGVQNTLTRQNVGAFGILTRTGGTIAVFAAAGGAYQFTKTAAANLREKDDSYNSAIGGFFGGAMIGLKFRSIPVVLGYASATAVMLAAVDYGGGTLFGYQKDPEIDEVDRKEFLRKNRRRPLEQTVAELGEGRGIYAPGYEERRRERIKEKYGMDLSGVPSAH